MRQDSKLKLECVAIGSLPHFCVNEAMKLVKENFSNVPFWPQLAKISKNEDMIFQFLENMPAFFYEEDNAKSYLNTENDDFCEDFECFYNDYEECIANINSSLLDKYSISSTNSSAFSYFCEIIAETKPFYAKGQIVGPFTLATTLVDKYGRCAVYDDVLREIIVKTLTLKALWQINKIKIANPDTIPIIFIDEPSVSQLGTSAYITIANEDVISMLREISDAIKATGALSAIHCCGKCDWSVPIESGVDIINLDAYSFAQNLSVYYKDVNKFLESGGRIAWGIIPTLDKMALSQTNEDKIILKFTEAVNYLTNKGVNEKLIIENSLISPSCGAGSLSVELADKAMSLTKNVSERLKEIYKVDC